MGKSIHISYNSDSEKTHIQSTQRTQPRSFLFGMLIPHCTIQWNCEETFIIKLLILKWLGRIKYRFYILPQLVHTGWANLLSMKRQWTHGPTLFNPAGPLKIQTVRGKHRIYFMWPYEKGGTIIERLCRWLFSEKGMPLVDIYCPPSQQSRGRGVLELPFFRPTVRLSVTLLVCPITWKVFEAPHPRKG